MNSLIRAISFADRDRVLTRDDLTTITAADIRASRLFATEPGAPDADA